MVGKARPLRAHRPVQTALILAIGAVLFDVPFQGG